jgi:hypothetical protein
MKPLNLQSTTILIIFGLSLFSFSLVKDNYNTVKLNDTSLRVDKEVITIGDWNELVWYARDGLKNQELYLSMVADTALQRRIYGNGYNNIKEKFPVIGVTPNQIEIYCQLRESAIQKGIKMNEKKPRSTKFSILDKELYQKLRPKYKKINETYKLNYKSDLPELVKTKNGYEFVNNGEFSEIKDTQLFTFRCQME